MIEKIPDQIPVQTGEWRGTTFDIIPKETFGMACRKINEIVDAVNELQENQNTYWTDIAEIKKELLQTPAENVLTKSLRMDKEFAEDECVRLQNELERTRKALDVAVDALKEISLRYQNEIDALESVWSITATDMCDYADTALDKITALEQKE